MSKRNRSSNYPICKRANKKILVDRIQADLLLEYIQLNARRTIHEESRSYHCNFGNHYHLTSEDQRTENHNSPHSA
jgi:hypothetical protein